MNMNGLLCITCRNQFNTDSRVPLVLPCGDSVCLQCLFSISSSSPNPVNNPYQCPVCWHGYNITNIFIKELPKNKALLSFLPENTLLSPRSSPSSRVLFPATPEAKRVFDSPEKRYGSFTPSTYSGQTYSNPVILTSPTSVSMKCSRPGCYNDRYFLDGQVWDYCCINCKNGARMIN
jgi:hypothetical protein